MAAGRDAKSTCQNRFSSAGHGHSCQPTERHAPGAGGSVGTPTSPPGGPPGASPQWRVLRWLRDCLPTCGNKPHPKRLFKEEASGLVFKPLETLDKSLLCFYLHVNSQIGTFQEKTSTSSIITLGWLCVMLGDSRFRFRDSRKSANSWILPRKRKKRHWARVRELLFPVSWGPASCSRPHPAAPTASIKHQEEGAVSKQTRPESQYWGSSRSSPACTGLNRPSFFHLCN